MAWMQIRAGMIDRAIIGGTEAPSDSILFAAFDRLGIMSRTNDDPARASRPFADDRDGFVLSEGAAVCIVESEHAAAARGARAIAEIAGYAATSDAFHPFSPLPSGEESIRAVRLALEGAGLGPEAVDYVNAHAIGSRPNDPIEVDVIKNVFRGVDAARPDQRYQIDDGTYDGCSGGSRTRSQRAHNSPL